MKVILVSKCSLDSEQYVEFKMFVLISPSKSLISSRWVTYTKHYQVQTVKAENCSSSSWFGRSETFLALYINEVSSAYMGGGPTVLHSSTAHGRQFTKIIKSNGPSIEPYGIPILIGWKLDKVEFTLTVWNLLVKYDFKP